MNALVASLASVLDRPRVGGHVARSAVVAAWVLALAACASAPPQAPWRASAQGALENFERVYLEGRTRIADQEFARARSALSATGRADLVARAELVRCASRVASLDFDDCPGFQALAGDAAAPERAYAAFLAGKAGAADIALLPAHHRAVASGDAGALPGIEDPLSRLVAAGVLFRQGRATPATIQVAVDTASDRGWRRPLIAWLAIQARRADEAGDGAAAAAIRRRMGLVTGDTGER